jgi:hypothetical protein
VLFFGAVYGQHDINLKLDTLSNSLIVKQKTVFVNTSAKPLTKIYLHAWANAYKTKTTALARRFEENYSRSFHLAKEKDRGNITIDALFSDSMSLKWHFLKDSIDIIQIDLKKPLKAKDTLVFKTNYSVKLPNAKFTKYGVDKHKNYFLKHWYLVPAMLDNGDFHLMNNKGLDDLWMSKATYNIELIIPKNYTVISPLTKDSLTNYYAESQVDIRFEILKKSNYKTFVFDDFTILTDMFSQAKLSDTAQALQLERIKHFLEKRLGKYPFKKLVLSQYEYNQNPVFGVNQLPSFVNPYPKNFEWDLKLLKIYLQAYFDNVLLVNKRNDYQFIKGIQAYLMMQYVDETYPDTKMLGKLSKIWGIRSFEIAKLDYNDKYWLYYQYIARKALDQSLDTSIDELSNYNRNVANPYKAALGLRYLAAYSSDSIIAQSIKKYYQENKFKQTSSQEFKHILQKEIPKNIAWFFKGYAQTNTDIDYKIQKVKVVGNSLQVVIKNKRDITVPILLYGIKKDTIVFKKWLPKINKADTVYIKNGNFNRLVLNYENLYPEINQRDNWKRVNSHPLFNKPLKLGVFEDVENPFYNQLFIIPRSDYNYYDGILLGAKINNKTYLRKNFYFDLKPYYGVKSGNLTGSGNIFYKKRFQNRKLKSYRFGLGFSYYHFSENLTYKKYTPYLQFIFRDKNYRLSTHRSLTFSQIRLDKDDDGTSIYGEEAIQYNVFNASYVHIEPGDIRSFVTKTNVQFAKKFGKASFDIRYKKLTLANRQWDLRAYIGTFLYNSSTSGYYDFALDKPTDYLFQYGYFGRSETTGILSQQYFIAEGGFKSYLTNSSANQWVFATNASTNIWKWIEVYGDLGWTKNKATKTKFFYDSGIRLNLVNGHFEAYFPLYSSNGFEPKQAHYSSKIRLVYTTDIKRLFNFYKRSWH